MAEARARVLVVDDEADMRETCRRILVHAGFEVEVAASAEEAEHLLESESFSVLVADLVMPGKDGISLARAARRRSPNLAVLVITAHPTVEAAMRATREGACDFIPKPFTMRELEVAIERALQLNTLRSENERLKRQIEASARLDTIVGDSPAIRQVCELIQRVANTDASVLIAGESGTGKELVARSVHANSSRRAQPFIAIDCGAVPDTLIESELFGAERGSYTGAVARRAGVLESAHGGTIFLDEISNLPMPMQVKLLRVLQERTLRRIGGTAEISVNVRVVAASNQNLAALVREGRFRSDLYYRLKVVEIELPPLRDRPGDIPLLAQHFVRELAARHGGAVSGVSSAALLFLSRYHWPGNVRELRNVLERAMLLSESNQVMPVDLPEEIVEAPSSPALDGDFNSAKKRAVNEFELGYLQALLKEAGGNISRAAARAGLQRTALHRLLVRHGLKAEDYRS